MSTEIKKDIKITEQAFILIDNGKLDTQDIKEWYVNHRGIIIGGGDIIDYLIDKQKNKK